MHPRLKASRAAIELIKRFEGFRPTSAQVADGRWTIGYGHTRTAREGVTITEADAEALLRYDLIEIQEAVNDAVLAPLRQNQFDALVSFASNIGLENFRRSSVLRLLNAGDDLQAACAIEMWRKADVDGGRSVIDALVRRRALEKSLFLTPDGEAWEAAPTVLMPPRVDYDVAASLPRVASPTGAAAPTLNELRIRDIAEAEAGIDLDPSAPDANSAEPSAWTGAPPAPGDTGVPRRIVRHEAPPASPGPPAREPAKPGDLQFLALGFIGLALFAGSLFWGVGAEKSYAFFNPMMVASILGGAGILMVAGAVYFLLVNLSGRSDDR